MKEIKLFAQKDKVVEITWFVNVIKADNYKYSLGYCERGKGIAFVTVNDSLTPFLVDNVRISNKSCSGAEWCLNLECPLNKINVKNYQKLGMQTLDDIKALHNRLKELEKMLKDAELDFEKYKGGICVFKEPIIVMRPPS